MRRILTGKRIVAFFLVLVILVLTLPAAGAVSMTVNYNANMWDYFKNRTQKQISSRYSTARYTASEYVDWDTTTYYEQEPSLAAPYSAGVLKADIHEMMTEVTNYYRWLIGAMPLSTASKNNDALQAGALVRNWQHSHVVDRQYLPSDFPDTLWNAGSEVEHNIIAWNYSPRDAIAGWIDEGYDLRTDSYDTVGHRASLLFANVSCIDFAFSGNVAMGDQVSFDNQLSLPFYSFPSAGYFPYNDLEATTCAWTVELNTDRVHFNSLSDLTVRVTNVNTGAYYDCTGANGKLTNRSGSYSFDNLLTFVQPTPVSGDAYYSDGDSYNVTVTGLKDNSTGYNAKLEYTTKFFDVTTYSPGVVTEVSAGEYDVLHIYEGNATAENLKMLAASLPQYARVEDEYGRSALLPVAGAWSVDSTNKCFINSCKVSELPTDFVDSNGLLSRIVVAYDDTNAKMENSRLYLNSTGLAGDYAEFKLWRYLLAVNSVGHARIYRATADTAGGYQAAERLTITAEPYTEGAIPETLVERISPLSATDSGTYFCIYYYSQGDSYSAGYVTDFQKLEVTGEAASEPTLVTISLVQKPFKNLYHVGEAFDAKGLLVMATYSDYSRRFVSDYQLSGFDNGKTGTQTVSVSYGGQVRSFRVDVEALLGVQHEHVYTSRIVPATCTEQGYTMHTCECGKYYMDTYTSAIGHDIVTDEAVAPTCTTPGFTQGSHCTRCEAATEVQTEIPALGHTFQWVIDKIATETESGIKHEECTRCRAKQSENTFIPPTGSDHAHTFVSTVTAPTCTGQGFTRHTCACGETYVDSFTPALGHSTVTDPAIAATCMASGLTQGSHCSRCGEIFLQQTTQVALGHNLIDDAAVAASCTQTGKTAGTHCTRCDYKTGQTVINALGHSWDAGTITTAATETTGGVKTYTCTRCKLTRTEFFSAVTIVFSDVSAEKSYAAAVNWAVANDITLGTSNTTFSPDKPCTRGQVVTFLWRAAGEPEPTSDANPFSDIRTNVSYYKAVLWAVEQGITSGTSRTTFSPDQGCTRGQVATFLWRFEGKPTPSTTANPFKDNRNGDFYYTAVLWAVENGITKGTGANTFSPEAICTRGQIVTFLYRNIGEDA